MYILQGVAVAIETNRMIATTVIDESRTMAEVRLSNTEVVGRTVKFADK